MPDINFEIVKHIAVLSTSKHGWTKELNRVKWGNRKAAYDIRLWDPEHERMSRGITLSDSEYAALSAAVRGGVNGTENE